MFAFIKKVFVVAMTFFSCNPLKSVSMNNQESKIKTKIIGINNNETSFILIVIKISTIHGDRNYKLYLQE